MARFSGTIGFGESVLKSPGNWEDVITARPYKGEVKRFNSQFRADDQVSGEVSVSHSISVVADQYAIDHLQGIRYVNWNGGDWVVTSVQLNHPRLVLGLGEVYNGPKA